MSSPEEDQGRPNAATTTKVKLRAPVKALAAARVISTPPSRCWEPEAARWKALTPRRHTAFRDEWATDRTSRAPETMGQGSTSYTDRGAYAFVTSMARITPASIGIAVRPQRRSAVC